MDDWPIIFQYTRAQAIEDGVLIDVTAQAAELGFRVHTVVTDSLYHGYVVPPDGLDISTACLQCLPPISMGTIRQAYPSPSRHILFCIIPYYTGAFL